MNLSFKAEVTKEKIFQGIEQYLRSKKFNIDKQDRSRPWGGFFVIDELQSELFISEFFSHFEKEDLLIGDKLSPKILVVAPNKRLSWQYHHRRAEIWKLIGGEATVITSDTDEEKNKKLLKLGDIVQLRQGERHRLIGVNQWGIVAEIWRHINAQHPSDEDDIVRVQDDFGR